MISKGDALLQWGVNTTVEFLAEHLKGEISSEDLEQLFKAAKYAHRIKKEEAAGIGTIAHKWLECYLKGDPPSELPDNEFAANSVRAALKWLESNNYVLVESEKRLYSQRYGFAGTLDVLARINGRDSILDFKTSKGFWDEYRYQTAAYQLALEEESGQKIEERWLLRIDKQTAEFQELQIPRTEYHKDKKAFLGALAIHKRQKELSKKPTKKGATQNA